MKSRRNYKVELPGSPRDLGTMKAHMYRLADWSVDLWKAEDLTLHMCDGSVVEDKATLNAIRQDGCAVLGCVNHMIDLLAEIAHAPKDATADDLRKIAQRVIKT